ncbi:hypothetical protein [Cohnella soli]|uniref:Uncharacterized protein n=1 Tax=Cohnella soli TaxID=425005 RepID=A0ABW0HLU8_9BACL
MTDIVLLYIGLQVVIVAAAVWYTIAARRRRLKQNSFRPPIGFLPTDEVFIDPTTGVKQQVWFNPETGERFYQRIDKK